MQVYRGLDVLTNKVPFPDQNGVPHHLLGTVSPSVEFTAKEFRDAAIPEETRDHISALETEMLIDSDKIAAAFDRIVKYMVARKEADKKLDVQYQRKIAEALDNHITVIQRDHERKSQIEEKRIQNDAAEARREKALQEGRLRHEARREKALQEGRLRQEKARAEAEEKARAEEAAKLAALAAAKEAAEKKANDLSKQLASAVSKEKAVDVVRAAKNALFLEQERIQKLRRLEEENNSLIMQSNVDFSAHQRNIGRLIRTMSGVQQNVIGKASEIIKILLNPSCPQAISILAFAEKVVSNAQTPSSSPFASAHVIVLVASKVPQVLDFVLAELHRACIYSVPKHIAYSESVFKSKEAYFKELGFQQQHDGNLESDKSYLERLKSYMMLYGALVQMETIQSFQNLHGPKEGWAWLARFLNSLPANIYTVAALHAFLTTAGFVLFSKYKSQFVKLMNVVRDDFLPALRGQKDLALGPIIAEIRAYIDDGQFRKEPEGRQLQAKLLSNIMLPQPEHSPNYNGYNRHF